MYSETFVFSNFTNKCINGTFWRSFLSLDTRLECRGAKFLAKVLRGLKITRKILRGLKNFPSEKNKGCETIRNAKFSSARENRV